jgi:ATP-dependent HslUV protease ATP-binding subunit HslU
MAALNDSPFIKVEATKFTEVGYHGRDVDQIIRDLMDIAIILTRKLWTKKLRAQAEERVENRILDILTGPAPPSGIPPEAAATAAGPKLSTTRGRESFRDMLRQGILDYQEIDVDMPNEMPSRSSSSGVEMGDSLPPGIVTLPDLWNRLSSGGGGDGSGSRKASSERKRMPIAEARDVLLEIELNTLLEGVDLKKEAVNAVEETGIVFIDEIDKICTSRDGVFGGGRSADASAEGVQRDLLPLIEGTTIQTKYGNVNTDYILFVASGAFHAVKPSDLLPELQGRLPIRVELQGLTEEDLYKILTEPVANLVRQQIELIATEGVVLKFEDEAIREMARYAAYLNRTVENIGARRLHTVMERIVEQLSFDAAEVGLNAKSSPDSEAEPSESSSAEKPVFVVDKELVTKRLADVTRKHDLSKYIL